MAATGAVIKKVKIPPLASNEQEIQGDQSKKIETGT
jgi:hypothetical protein